MHPILASGLHCYPYAETGYANPHAVTAVGGTTHTYDNNGNVTAIGSLDYTWDWRNRLATAERTGGGITTYGYDQHRPEDVPGDGQRDHLVPQPVLQRRLELAHGYHKEAHFFSPDGTLVARVVASGTANASTTYLHPDHLGGTNVVTDEDREVVQNLAY